MTPSSDEIRFTAQHHALLFTCMSKSVILEAGEEQGGRILRDAVKKYGEQRGRRMALRAKKNGHPLTMDNYLAYGEWEVPKGEMKFRFAEKTPHARLHVFKCPWNDIWMKNDLVDYGHYFCREIDAALVRGFNPELEIEINSTQTTGGNYCDFLFKEANLSLVKILGLIYKKKINPGKDAIMPWEYHTGHLFKTLSDVIKNELEPASEAILTNALEAFTALFSERHADTLKGYQATDFERLPN